MNCSFRLALDGRECFAAVRLTVQVLPVLEVLLYSATVLGRHLWLSDAPIVQQVN